MAQVKEVEVNGKIWNKENIKELLRTNNKAVEKAILVIYSYQTSSEQATEQTYSENGVGFNQCDSVFLSSLAKQLENGRTLSLKQLEIAKKKIVKYAGQLLKHMYNMQNT